MVEILEVGHVCFFYRPRVWPETVTQRSRHDRHADFDLSDKAMRVLVENAIMAGVLAADCTRKVRPWLDSVVALPLTALAWLAAPARPRGLLRPGPTFPCSWRFHTSNRPSVLAAQPAGRGRHYAGADRRDGAAPGRRAADVDAPAARSSRRMAAGCGRRQTAAWCDV